MEKVKVFKYNQVTLDDWLSDFELSLEENHIRTDEGKIAWCLAAIGPVARMYIEKLELKSTWEKMKYQLQLFIGKGNPKVERKNTRIISDRKGTLAYDLDGVMRMDSEPEGNEAEERLNFGAETWNCEDLLDYEEESQGSYETDSEEEIYDSAAEEDREDQADMGEEGLNIFRNITNDLWKKEERKEKKEERREKKEERREKKEERKEKKEERKEKYSNETEELIKRFEELQLENRKLTEQEGKEKKGSERIKEGAQIKESRKRKEPDNDQLEPPRIPKKIRKLEEAVRTLCIKEEKERPPEGSELEPAKYPDVNLEGIIIHGANEQTFKVKRNRHLWWFLNLRRVGPHEKLRIVGIEGESGLIQEKGWSEMFREWLNEKEDRTIVCTKKEIMERYGARSTKGGAVC